MTKRQAEYHANPIFFGSFKWLIWMHCIVHWYRYPTFEFSEAGKTISTHKPTRVHMIGSPCSPLLNKRRCRFFPIRLEVRKFGPRWSNTQQQVSKTRNPSAPSPGLNGHTKTRCSRRRGQELARIYFWNTQTNAIQSLPDMSFMYDAYIFLVTS